MADDVDYSNTLVKEASNTDAMNDIFKKLNEKKKSQQEIDALNEKWKKLQLKVERLKQASLDKKNE